MRTIVIYLLMILCYTLHPHPYSTLILHTLSSAHLDSRNAPATQEILQYLNSKVANIFNLNVMNMCIDISKIIIWEKYNSRLVMFDQ